MADYSMKDMLVSLLIAGLSGLIVYWYNIFRLKPESLKKRLQLQGISGPSPSFFFGNLQDLKRIKEDTAVDKDAKDSNIGISHDYISYIYPHLLKWRQEYGPTYVFYLGSMPVLYMSDKHMVRECLQSKNIEFGRPSYMKTLRGAILGGGILTVNGSSWVHQRKILASEFLMHKVKNLMDIMLDSANLLVNKWENKIQEQGGVASVRIDQDVKEMAAEIISKTLFGSYYALGNEIAGKIKTLQDVLSQQTSFLGIPGFRHIPIKSNRDAWKLSKEIKNIVLQLIEEHKTRAAKENDLLEVLIENICTTSSDSASKDTALIADNCKGLFFAGHETTAGATSFALLLLAHHPKWQQRINLELEEIRTGQDLNLNDALQKMKTLTIVILETMRLYPATPVIARGTTEDMKFGNLVIPEGANIWIPVFELHYDPTNWGQNASEFDPERFANGISAACKFPHMYMPFGLGIHSCLGQNFAMMEMKIVLSLILSKFTFSLPPDYHHEIVLKLTLEPKHGAHLLMKMK